MKKIKLNIGGGKRFYDGFINIDAESSELHSDFLEKNSGFIQTKADNLPFSDESVEEIKAEYVLEHIYPWQHKETLWEWWRVLELEGKLHIEVPNFEECCREFIRDKSTFEMMHYQILNTIVNPEKRTPHCSLFYKDYLRKILGEEGFRVNVMKTVGTDIICDAVKIKKGLKR